MACPYFDVQTSTLNVSLRNIFHTSYYTEQNRNNKMFKKLIFEMEFQKYLIEVFRQNLIIQVLNFNTLIPLINIFYTSFDE